MIDLGRPGIWGWGTSQSWLVHGVSTLEHFRTTDGKNGAPASTMRIHEVVAAVIENQL